MRKLSNAGKWIVGILTGLQLFGALAMVIWIVSYYLPVFMTVVQSGEPETIIGSLTGFIVAAVILGLVSTGLLIFYIVHVAMNKSLTTPMKVLWILLFLIFGVIPEVVYFFMEITPEHSLSAKMETTTT